MPTYVKLTCSQCNERFERTIGEHTSQTKEGRTTFFCSRSCACTYKNQHLSDTSRKKISKRMKKQSTGNQFAKKGEFTYHLKKSLKRQKHGKPNLTEEYLASIWTGVCALSNIPISKWSYKTNNLLDTASLDRIDSDKGYVIGNVQFVAYGINLAKCSFSNSEMIQFIKNIRSAV